MRKKVDEIEKKLESPSITSSIRISSCVINQDSALQDGRQLDFECVIQDSEMQWIKANTLMDTGASALGFVSSTFVKQHRLSVVKLAQPCNLKLADDSLAPVITHCAQVYFRLGDHYDEIWCFVTSLGKFDLILGMSWLEQHDPKLSFRKRTMIFDSEFCKSGCLPHGKSCTVNSCSSGKDETKSDSLTRRSGKDSSDSRHLQHQATLNRTNLDDNIQTASESTRHPDTPDKEPAITLAANIIGWMSPRQWMLMPTDKSQADVSSWAKTCQPLSTASIQLQDHTPYYGNPGGSSNLTAAIATSQAVTTKRYHSQPGLKLPTPAGRQVLPVAKENSQVWTDTSGYQNIVGNFYHRNREKVSPHPRFRTPEPGSQY